MKKPLSFKLLYLLLKISYWGLIVVIAIVVFAGTIMLTLDPELMELGFSSDLYHLEEVVYLNTEDGTPVEVELFADTIKVPVKHLTRTSMLYVLVPSILWLSCALIIINYLKRFMRKVMDGETFYSESILLIKKAALGLLAIELIDIIAAVTGHFYVKNHFDLGSLEHEFSLPFPSTALILALTLWALAHIFQKGKELEDEQKLTV